MPKILARACLAGGLAVVACLSFTVNALAHSGAFAKFNYCPRLTAKSKNACTP